MKIPGKEKIEYVLIDISCGCANVDKVHTLQLSEETYPLSDEMFANDALVVDNDQIEEAWLCHKDGTPYVGVRRISKLWYLVSRRSSICMFGTLDGTMR